FLVVFPYHFLMCLPACSLHIPYFPSHSYYSNYYTFLWISYQLLLFPAVDQNQYSDKGGGVLSFILFFIHCFLSFSRFCSRFTSHYLSQHVMLSLRNSFTLAA